MATTTITQHNTAPQAQPQRAAIAPPLVEDAELALCLHYFTPRPGERSSNPAEIEAYNRGYIEPIAPAHVAPNRSHGHYAKRLWRVTDRGQMWLMIWDAQQRRKHRAFVAAQPCRALIVRPPVALQPVALTTYMQSPFAALWDTFLCRPFVCAEVISPCPF